MTRPIRNFYLGAIWAPLVLPAIAWAGFAVRGSGTFEGIGADVGFLLVITATLGGVPYAVAALGATWWVLRRATSERQVRRMMLAAPILVTPVALSWWIVTFGMKEGLKAGVAYAVLLTLYLIPIGYLYVLGAFIGRAGMRYLERGQPRDVAAT